MVYYTAEWQAVEMHNKSWQLKMSVLLPEEQKPERKTVI